MNFISSIFSTYFSIMDFSIITKIIILVFIILYVRSIIKILKFKFIEIVYAFIGGTVGLLSVLIVGSIYKVIYNILMFIAYGANFHSWYSIPFTEIGCVILTMTFLMVSYLVLDMSNDEPTEISRNRSYNSDISSGQGLYAEYSSYFFQAITYDEFLERREYQSFDEITRVDNLLSLNNEAELYKDDERERELKEKLESSYTSNIEWDYHTGEYMEK